MADDGTNDYEASLVDLTPPTQWVSKDVEAALSNLCEIMWNEGISIPGMTITLHELPGEPLSVGTDFGIVHFKEQE